MKTGYLDQIIDMCLCFIRILESIKLVQIKHRIGLSYGETNRMTYVLMRVRDIRDNRIVRVLGGKIFLYTHEKVRLVRSIQRHFSILTKINYFSSII